MRAFELLSYFGAPSAYGAPGKGHTRYPWVGWKVGRWVVEELGLLPTRGSILRVLSHDPREEFKSPLRGQQVFSRTR